MHYRKKGSLLRKGIAAFLLFLMVSSSLAFAADTGEVTDNTEATATQETDKESSEGQESSQPAEASEEFEMVGTVEVETEDSESQEAVEDIIEDGSVMIFAQGEATSKTVTLYSKGKIKYESGRTHLFRVSCDGQELISYCIEPKKTYSGKAKHTAKPYNSALMTKALYYSYGSPGYSEKTEQYLEGISRKDCYMGDQGAYILCHIMLSYIYDGEKSSTDAFMGCSSATKKVVKNLLAAVKSWPDPPGRSEIGLSAATVDASWNEEKLVQETPEIKVGGTEGNSIDVPVPEGATLYKGELEAQSGTVNVAVGESFRITAPSTVQGSYESPAMAAAITDFQPYIIQPKGKQSQLFNLSTVNSISYSINWVDFGRVDLTKTSADPGITDGNTYYTLEGANYGLYSKATDKKYAELVTGEDGQAFANNIPYGEYYLKEIEPSRGYELDVATHDIKVAAPAQSETVLENPTAPDISTSATIAETGESSATEGGVLNISDTVKYSGVEPGMEYTIVGKLVDKSTGREVEGTESEVVFTPENSSGSLKMDYELDSEGLGGSTVVAFERLYQGNNLIAVHEDINNKAESVDITKPMDREPDTGDGMNLLILAFALAISGLAGLTVIMKKN
ncbi:MAG: VaFE repeat-containing surface-anchored protein [Bacillota bacterium]|nr:VaFE repeat-containing surface-anchored protein [Bacillota bacterium]